MGFLHVLNLMMMMMGFTSFVCHTTTAMLSPDGVNFEVQALMEMKASFDEDSRGAMSNWDANAVDPCSWSMVTCSPDKFVVGLAIPSQGLCGTISPHIGNLTHLEIVLLQNNNLSGLIPAELGNLPRLKTLDLSDNNLTGEIPASLAQIKTLQYVRLNNNSLSGAIPMVLANMTQLTFLDLSFNNLKGPVPRLLAKTFNILGNTKICKTGKESECNGTTTVPPSPFINSPKYFLSLRPQANIYGLLTKHDFLLAFKGERKSAKSKTLKVALAFGSSLGCICLVIVGIGFSMWCGQRRTKQIFFDVNEQHKEEVCLGNLRVFQFRELQVATNNFTGKNLLGKGGFGNVYKGRLQDGTMVAVKRLKDGNTASGDVQFQTEVEMISLAVHRNLLRLYGFCMTSSERLLVYPYMSNGSVASRLKGKWFLPLRALEFGKAANQKGAMLDWRPKMSEVVRMLEGDGLAEKWEASQKVEPSSAATKCSRLNNELSSSDRYSDLTEDSSLLVQAMELSGPR
ncbi:hypothetical protein DM860_000241 [Cuscuta australis]|uniref:Protein kinase domain-containing protein n=1 Tax=Cuscuta australis TaxID=267555 RepID=A0A328CVX7_9ASTE|nr:hypothetical protein DM860_000241 [Cuscuta australis]